VLEEKKREKVLRRRTAMDLRPIFFARVVCRSHTAKMHFNMRFAGNSRGPFGAANLDTVKPIVPLTFSSGRWGPPPFWHGKEVRPWLHGPLGRRLPNSAPVPCRPGHHTTPTAIRACWFIFGLGEVSPHGHGTSELFTATEGAFAKQSGICARIILKTPVGF